MKKILSVHSGTQHSQQIVMALKESGLLYKHATSIYNKDEWIINLLKSTSKSFRAGIANRSMDGISDDEVFTYPYYELIEIIIRKLFGNNKMTTGIIPRIRDELFSKAVSRSSILDIDLDGVIGFPNCSYEIFKRAKYVNNNVKLYIEQPIGHYMQAEKILFEEQELHPEFADSITFISHSENFKKRTDNELNMADKIFCGSNFVKKTLIKSGYESKKLFVNNYGSFIHPSHTVSKTEKGCLNVLFVGQVSQRKGIKYLLEAVKNLKASNIKINLRIVGKVYGSGAWLPKYEPVIDELISHCDRNKLKEIMKSSDVFVLPSLFEGSALVVYEAQSIGLPCIVTPNTGSDFIDDKVNGFIVPIRDTYSIQEHLFSLSSNEILLNEMKENCLKNSNLFSWSNYRKRLINQLAV